MSDIEKALIAIGQIILIIIAGYLIVKQLGMP
jgi:hypothetical protein